MRFIKELKDDTKYLDVKSLKFVRNLPGRIIYSIVNVTTTLFCSYILLCSYVKKYISEMYYTVQLPAV
jgi:hypothetical protein